MTTDQLTGPLRAIAPILIALLVSWGLDSTTAGFLAAAVIALLSAAWSWYANRPVAIATEIAKMPGVQVNIGPSASVALRRLAADPRVSGIVEARP